MLLTEAYVNEMQLLLLATKLINYNKTEMHKKLFLKYIFGL
jgi:hypothetical protein